MTPQQIEHISKAFGAEVTPCGSRVTCNPAPTDTDADFLVVVGGCAEAHLSELVNYLQGDGWNWEGSEHYQTVATDGFMSWRKESANLIVTKNAIFALKHKAATHVCKTLNLMDKADRILVFQAVLYANHMPPEHATQKAA